ncbi:LacI family DNA-binding transcriptional regulator [Microbacterium sediminicola]|uniref:LacI family DNA-binding transcriptional regulator n=1 Tax=Microbacterium sediminicola TaxID=415210 RepID=A0ABN2I8I4_9MICO
MAVGVKDVAAAAGVSVGTVSNVLNQPEKVAPATVEKVQRVIDELGFVRNDAARQLRAGRSRSVGLIVLDIGNPFFAQVARGAEARAQEAGLSVLMGSSDESTERESRYLDLFREQRVNGVLVTPVDEGRAAYARLAAAGVPVVLLDRDAPDGVLGSVSVDDVEGGHLAAAHLLELGRRALAFVGGPDSLRQVADRLEGARRAVRGFADARLEVVGVPALSVLSGREAGERIAARSREDWPDAIFCANDLVAVGILQAFALTGAVRVPEDIALIGYDDIDFAAAAVVPLTSVRQPAWQMGYTAVDMLLRDPDDVQVERRVRYRPELAVRTSTTG